MAVLRAKQLAFADVTVAGAGQLLYEVPESHRAIVRSLHLTNQTAVEVPNAIVLVRHSSGYTEVFLHSDPLPANGSSSSTGLDATLEAHDQLRSFCQVAGWTVLASGMELPLPPAPATKPVP